MQALLDRGIATRRGIMCAHREQAYQKEPWRSIGILAASEKAQETAVILPLYPDMSATDQEAVSEAIRYILTPECVF
jgi:dTDP-4-amino-4,6-dideoxygalactose transaminase